MDPLERDLKHNLDLLGTIIVSNIYRYDNKEIFQWVADFFSISFQIYSHGKKDRFPNNISPIISGVTLKEQNLS